MTRQPRFRAAMVLPTVALMISISGRSAEADGAVLANETINVAVNAKTTKETFSYKKVGDLSIKADVYRPPEDGPRPVIIWIHGGALIFGSREMLPSDERDQFVRAGYVIVSIDYRLAPETKLPEILKDVEDAHQWVREKAPALFHIDPDRMAVVGQSAGAYLALMAGARVRPRLKAVISFYGYGNIAGEWYSRPDPVSLKLPEITKEKAYKVVGGPILSQSSPSPRDDFYLYCRQKGIWPQQVAALDPDSQLEKFKPYSPENLVTSTYPPTMLLHGDRDTEVPFYLSQRMADALERAQVENLLYRMEGFNHLFDVFPDGLPPEGKPIGLQNAKVAEAFRSVLMFLAGHIAN